jgi:outer membrane protein
VQTALRQNLALTSSRLAADVAYEDIAIQRGNRLPTVSLSASYGEDGSERTQTVFRDPLPPTTFTTPQNPDRRSWSLDLTFPLYAGGGLKSRVQQSVYTHRAATEALERIARQTERQTRDAYLGVIAEISRVRALRTSRRSGSASRRPFATSPSTSTSRLTSSSAIPAGSSRPSIATTPGSPSRCAGRVRGHAS